MSLPAAPAPRDRAPRDRALDERPPDDWREPLAASTGLVVRAARGLDDDALRAPSLLPGWTRGHVLTHLARNADGFGNLVTWAVTGVETPMYADRATRDADIERGAGRPAAEVADDVEASARRLGEALERLTGPALEAALRLGSGAALRGGDIPWGRRRELEVHLVDLDVGRTPAHWPADFVRRTLDELSVLFRTSRDTPVRSLRGTTTGRSWEVGATGPELVGGEGALLAWLTGRSDGDGLEPDPPGPVPPAPRWA